METLIRENCGSPQTPNRITIWEEEVQGETRRQRPRALSLHQLAVTTKRLSLSLWIITTTITTFHINCFSPSYIYTYITFELFTNIASSSAKEHIYYMFLLVYTGSNQTGFPKKLPLHSGMGCVANLIRLRHTSNFSANSILVNMSEPFSYVGIFLSAKSLSSTLSQSQWCLLWMCLFLKW